LAKIKDKYVVIEVKTRTSEKAGKAIEAVNKRKYNNLIKAMGSLALLHDISPENIELDIIAIDLKKDEKSAKIKHYRSII
jgi:Holliday junction resolvase-like predicted endonuclease